MNGTVAITEAEVTLAPNPATVNLSSLQQGAQFSWVCGQARGSGETATCSEAQITVTSRAQGFQEETKVIRLTPGQTLHESFDLKRTISAPVKVAKTCASTDLAQAGWTQAGQWFVAGGGASFPCGGLAGQYQFTILLPAGLFGKSVTWAVQGEGPQKQFELQKKAFQAKGGGKSDIGRFEEKGSITFRVIVEAGRIVHEARDGEGWHPVNVTAGDFKSAKIFFSKDARIANFSFREQ